MKHIRILLTAISKRRFNYIDGFSISFISLAANDGRFVLALVMAVVGGFVSAALEYMGRQE